MRRSATMIAAAAVALGSFAACGGSGSSTGGPPSGGPTAIPTPSQTQTPTPTAMPTNIGIPTTACNVLALPLPGTYSSISTFGNVNGSTYTQDPQANSGAWNASTYATPTPNPSPVPTATASPTSAPTGSPATYIEYSGYFQLPGFNGINGGGPYTVYSTKGCFVLVATPSGQPVAPGGPFNSYALGFPGFSSATGVTSTGVANGAITQFAISNLTPTTGQGTFALDNNTLGTVTITGSQMVTFAQARKLLKR